MANTFNTTPGATVAREMLILYLNTGTSLAATWSAIGKRVEDSSIEFDWATESKIDIFGDTYTTVKKPTMTQSFDPCELDAADAAQQKIWTDAIRNHDRAAMTTYDCLLVHCYAGTAETAMFAERYPATAIVPTGLGGEGGGSVGMPIDVTFGGTRETGTAKIVAGVVQYTPDTPVSA